jgi:hypothetical protein
MESKIRWKTGEPQKEGEYIITLRNGKVAFDEYLIVTNNKGEEVSFWSNWDENAIVAWCNLINIDPYTV